MRYSRLIRAASALTVLLLLLFPAPAEAYIGPGAGFAFVSSFAVILLTLVSACFVLLTWPIRWIIRTIRGRHALRRSRVRRVVIVGLDGQDPELTEKFMAEGILPNFAKLRDEGTFSRLGTTLLAESPVAWSGFQTGCNPGKHKIFDFLVPNRKSHLPELSSAQVSPSTRVLKVGKYRIPLGKPLIHLGRKSQPFWKVLGDHGVFSTILRVPITFPPEKFHGVLLSAMCVPDLQGSQGMFFYYSSDPEDGKEISGGTKHPVERSGKTVKGIFHGPENTLIHQGGEMQVPFEVTLSNNGSSHELKIGKERYPLPLRQYTPYIRIEFKPGLGIKVRGLARFYLIEAEPHFRLYMTPMNIDPDKPALPISHPFTYAMYLAKTQGPFATLGLAEDTNALKSRILDEEAFLQQTYDIHEERERMLFDALEKTRRGLVVCVFDITDRLQHMFFRYLDENHPGNRTRETEKHKDAIRDLYRKMDDMIGRIRAKLDGDTVLMVMSDHGFKGFKRCVNLNTWLYQNGFLAIKGERPTGAEYFQDVDWSRTQAYAMGFGGIYLNLAGREARGIVQPGEEERQIKERIIAGLKELYDEQGGEHPLREVYDKYNVYSGPYVREAPDLMAGFRVGYRASVKNVTGGIADEIFEDNERDWSGDHNFNPPDVPGMFFCNKPIERDRPSILDIGPTVLDLFGVPVPNYCDGQSLMPAPGGQPS